MRSFESSLLLVPSPQPRVKLLDFQATHPLCSAYLPSQCPSGSWLLEGLHTQITFGSCQANLYLLKMSQAEEQTYSAVLPAPPCPDTAQSLGDWPDIPHLIAELSGGPWWAAGPCGHKVLTSRNGQVEGGNRTGSILRAGLHLGPDYGLWAICLVSMETTYQLENQPPHPKEEPQGSPSLKGIL